MRSLLMLMLMLVAVLVAPARAGETPARDAVPRLPAAELLDDIPDYAELLRRQWSAELPRSVVERTGTLSHFGRLGVEGEAQPMTLQECVALALKSNTSLKISRLDPVAATAGVRRAWSAFEPILFGEAQKKRFEVPSYAVNVGDSLGTTFLSGDVTFNDEATWSAGVRKGLVSGGGLSLDWTNSKFKANQSSVANPYVPRYTTTLNLSLNQPLLRGFGWRFALLLVDAAELGEKQALYAYQAQLAEIVARVEAAYWQLVASIQNVRAQEQGVDAARELLRQNEGKFNVGMLPQTAVLEARAEVARREANLIRARNQASIARDNLRAVVNHESDGALLNIEPIDEPTMIAYQVDLERSLRTAREQRPELLAARLAVEEKKLHEKAAENQLLPSVNLAASIGLNGVGGSNPIVPNPAAPRFAQPNPQVLGGYSRSLELLTDGRYYNYLAGVTVEIPLDRARAKAEYGLARVDTQRAALTFQQVEEGVTLEVKQAAKTVDTDLKSIEATRLSRELAEENLRNQKARYDVGLATTKDLLDFQDRLTQARTAEIEALTRYNIDVALLRRFDGTLLEARNIVLDRHDAAERPWWARF